MEDGDATGFFTAETRGTRLSEGMTATATLTTVGTGGGAVAFASGAV